MLYPKSPERRQYLIKHLLKFLVENEISGGEWKFFDEIIREEYKIYSIIDKDLEEEFLRNTTNPIK